MTIVKSIAVIMIAYDLLIHLLHLVFTREFFQKRKIIFWPVIYGKFYDLFWSLYWIVVIILVLN